MHNIKDIFNCTAITVQADIWRQSINLTKYFENTCCMVLKEITKQSFMIYVLVCHLQLKT